MPETLWPALARLQPIGVNGANEAVEMLLFCSAACRAAFLCRYADGEPYDLTCEYTTVDGHMCDQCGKQL